MTESQRAMVAARLANLAHGGNRKSDQAANLPLDDRSPVPPVTQASAAEMLNVSERTVRAAKVVQDKGDPELVAKVERNEVSVSAAADIATLPQRSSSTRPLYHRHAGGATYAAGDRRGGGQA